MVRVGDFNIGEGNSLALIAGPCIIEEENTYRIAKKLTEITSELNIPFIFKCSWDKANRTKVENYRGTEEYAVETFEKIKKQLKIPILTDFHAPEQARKWGEIVDVLQIPAFLSRQTDMLIAAGQYDKAVNIKKAQFMNPFEMKDVIKKVESTGNKNILVTERGTCFGYDTLVVDMRSLVILKEFGYPVVFDATHSIRLDNYPEWQKKFILPLARGAVAIGVNALFFEVHDDMEKALCDSKWMLDLKYLKQFLEDIK